MGDPICKWRRASVWTTVELVSALPKEEMTDMQFRSFMENSIYGKNFNKTPYQLACQLGLYYVDDYGVYHPRFHENISENEALSYLKKWIKRYYVPNPYTARRFEKVTHPVILMYAISNFIINNSNINKLEIVCDEIFNEHTGNLGNIKYILNNYSEIMKVNHDNNINLFLHSIMPCDISISRYDRKAFFENFD